MANIVAANGRGARPGKTEIVLLGTRRLRVRRDEPEHRFGPGQGLVEHGRVVVGALDGLGPLADRVSQARGVTDDDPDLLVLVEQLTDQLAADLPGRCGDDDH